MTVLETDGSIEPGCPDGTREDHQIPGGVRQSKEPDGSICGFQRGVHDLAVIRGLGNQAGARGEPLGEARHDVSDDVVQRVDLIAINGIVARESPAARGARRNPPPPFRPVAGPAMELSMRRSFGLVHSSGGVEEEAAGCQAQIQTGWIADGVAGIELEPQFGGSRIRSHHEFREHRQRCAEGGLGDTRSDEEDIGEEFVAQHGRREQPTDRFRREQPVTGEPGGETFFGHCGRNIDNPAVQKVQSSFTDPVGESQATGLAAKLEPVQEIAEV